MAPALIPNLSNNLKKSRRAHIVGPMQNSSYSRIVTNTELAIGTSFHRSIIAFLFPNGFIHINGVTSRTRASRNAAPGTIRRMFGVSVGSNAVHGSDSPQTAAQEIAFFFTAK